ncbi:MAG: peptidase M19 [Sphingomonas sanxanigenens]|uniref:Peptidase M19 n=1 Tax=Sphingomonas sanxanigenens TaxID=397260 RepID=A0A2W5A0J2_9SPHN|nr:MAG: peptidase M19 [Sphingomonas sanxanigenens]
MTRPRKTMFAIVLLLILAAILFFTLAPGVVERGMNKVTPRGLLTVSPRAAALHKSLQIADTHADTLLWSRNLLDHADRGQVDLPRLMAGNVALQVFSSVTKTPKGQNYDANGADSDNITLLAVAQLQPPRTWGSLLQRSLWHAEKLRRAEAGSNGHLRIVRSATDLRRLLADRAKGRQVTGAMLSIEGLQDLEGRIDNLDTLYDAGFRMAGLAHFFDNELAGSMHGVAKGGLTPLGRQAVRAMEAKGMIVDIAHSSHAAVADILAMAKKPVVSSHGGVQATCKVNRNLTDEEIRGVARTGGVVGIGYWDGAVCDISPASIAKAIAHVRDLVGIAHVGLGSDYDGAVTTAFDSSQLAQITQALIDRGFTDDEIRAVMGGNTLRLLMQNLPQQ